mgnify:FL=1
MALGHRSSVSGATRQLVRVGEYTDAIRSIETLSTFWKVLHLPLAIKLKSELAALDFEYTPSMNRRVRISSGFQCTSGKLSLIHI